MYTITFKYKKDDLVFVDFDTYKTIGKIESFRFSDNCLPLYKITDIDMYVPETMIFSLTEKQRQYFEANLYYFIYKINDYQNEIKLLKEKTLKLNEDCF